MTVKFFSSPDDEADCGRCKYSLGDTDYLADPASPCMFYMCVRQPAAGGGYTYVRHHMPCASGTVWDQASLTCGTDVGGVCHGRGNGDNSGGSQPGITFIKYIHLQHATPDSSGAKKYLFLYGPFHAHRNLQLGVCYWRWHQVQRCCKWCCTVLCSRYGLWSR